MAIDFLGMGVAIGVIGWIIASGYKKKTGRGISKLWKEKTEELIDMSPEYQRYYINKGVKI